MKKWMTLCLILLVLSGCSVDADNGRLPGLPERPSMQLAESNSTAKPTMKPTKKPKLGNVSIEYYVNQSTKPEPKTSDVYSKVGAEEIALWCMEYASSEGAEVDENGIPVGLSFVKIYELFDREDLIVIIGDKNMGFYPWPLCMMFTCKDGVMAPFPNVNLHAMEYENENLASAEEIRLIYDEGFPFPLVEVFSYSHKGNGEFRINRLNGGNLERLIGGAVTGGHFTEWGNVLNDPVWKGMGIKISGSFSCHYENRHLTPSYKDVNGDGYIDIILQGNFQCVREEWEGNVLASQEVKEVYLYDVKKGEYIYNGLRSVRSPLEEYWNKIEWKSDLTEKG